MINNLSFISVIIACRDEEKYIGECLNSMINQDYPKEKMEILVIDGMSEDGTREILKKYIKKYPFIKIIDNPKKFTPFAFNIGIKNSRGDLVIIMGAHCVYEKDYVSKCVRYSYKHKADNVGGIIKTIPSKNTVLAKAIVLALFCQFGVGKSYFRIGLKEPKLVDTVFGGCYKKKVFEKIGLFNENLIRSQDMEFNLRLKKAGGKILLVPDIIAYYYSKSNLKDFFRSNFKDGFWAIYPLKFVKIPLRLRHYVPLAFVLSLLITGLLGIFFPVSFYLFLFIIGLYFLVNLYFSAEIAIREKSLKYLFVMPIVFTTRHFGYGLGSISGFIKLFLK